MSYNMLIDLKKYTCGLLKSECSASADFLNTDKKTSMGALLTKQMHHYQKYWKEAKMILLQLFYFCAFTETHFSGRILIYKK